MYCEQVLNNLIEPIMCLVHDSDDTEPIVHVNEYPGHPGNCWKHGCTCTPLQECIQCDDYHGISKRKRRKRKNKDGNDTVVSDEEKKLLRQFRQQERWEAFDDFGPIGGGEV